MRGSEVKADQAGEGSRPISPALTVGIVLMPLIFSWFVLRDGYSHRARALSVGWAVLSLLIAVITQQPATEARNGLGGGSARAAMREPPAKPKPVVEAAAAPAATNRRDESPYIEMLDNTVRDLQKEGFIRREDTAQATWAVALGTMGNVASMYADAANYDLTDRGRARQAHFMKEVGQLQAKDFPRIRALQAKALGEKLWQHDIMVETRGAGNSSLLFTGIIFGANYNIQKVMEAVVEDARAVRVKRLEFRAYRGDDITYYDIKPLPDSKVATFAFNRWTPVT